MTKKKIFITAFAGMAVIGLVIGIGLGMQSIKSTPLVDAQIQTKAIAMGGSYPLQPNIQQATNEVKKAIQITGREQHTAAEWADLKNKISADSEKKLFVASNGREYVLTIPQGLESSVSKVESQLEELAVKAGEVEKLRTPEQRAEVIKNIKSVFGVSEVEFLKGTNNQEYYRDNAGFGYFVNIPQNKVVRRQMAGDFVEKNADILAENGAWKAVNITKEKATEIASDFIKNKAGLGQITAESVIAGMTSEIIKGNYAFFFGDQGDKKFQFEIGIEPVSGKIIRYVNYLN